jgi:hypothetical protein
VGSRLVNQVEEHELIRTHDVQIISRSWFDGDLRADEVQIISRSWSDAIRHDSISLVRETWADWLQGQRTRTKFANALANCAVVSVQRAEQLVSLGEPLGGSPNSYISQLFHRAKFTGCFTARLPTASPRETKGKLMGDAQNCAENCTNYIESNLGSDFIGTLVPNFGCCSCTDRVPRIPLASSPAPPCPEFFCPGASQQHQYARGVRIGARKFNRENGIELR